MEDWKLAEAGTKTEEVTALTDSLSVGLAKAAIPDSSASVPE